MLRACAWPDSPQNANAAAVSKYAPIEVEGKEGLKRVPGSFRAFLKPHERIENVDALVGKTEVVSGLAGAHTGGGIWCKVCECLLKDSATYLNHINGKFRACPPLRTLASSPRAR